MVMSQLDFQQQKAQTNGQIIACFEAALTAGSAGPCNHLLLLLRGSTSTRKRMHAGSCMCSTAPLCMSLVALPGTPGSLSHGDMGHGSIGTASTNNVPLLFLFTRLTRTPQQICSMDRPDRPSISCLAFVCFRW